MLMRKLTGALMAAAALVACAVPAAAQDYPNKTVRVIIPLGAGGGGDIFTRAMSEELQKRLGQTFIVENRTGGGLNIGTRACGEARARRLHPLRPVLGADRLQPVPVQVAAVQSREGFRADHQPVLQHARLRGEQFAEGEDRRRADGARQEPARQAQLLDVLVSAGALHGRPEEEIRRRHRARALSQRQRGDDRAAVRRDADHAARAVEHGVDLAGGKDHRAGGQFQCTLAVVSRRCRR